MLYVDEDLCTGCGLCVTTCAEGAMSIHDCTSSVDQVHCTSCGRCVEVCPTGAIIVMEIAPEAFRASSPGQREAQPTWARAAAPHPATRPVASPAATPRPTPTKLDVIERVLTGLFAIAGYALDRNRSGSKWLPSLSRGGGGARSETGEAKACTGARQGRGGGKGLGDRRRRTDQCRGHGQNRTT